MRIVFSDIADFRPAYLTNERLINHSGGGSGGYLEYVFKNSAKVLFGKAVETIEYKFVRYNMLCFG